MTKWLRWLFWLAVLSGAGFAVWTALQRRNEPLAPAAPPARPTPTPAPPVPEAAAPPTMDSSSSESVAAVGEPVADPLEEASSDAGQRWRKPVDGMCPDGFPVKAARSGIYHLPGGRSYDRTAADRCYASAEDAEADGYRRAKA